MSLSEKIRPDVEAAPWVIAAIAELEAENAHIKTAIREFKAACDLYRVENIKSAEDAEVAHNQYNFTRGILFSFIEEVQG